MSVYHWSTTAATNATADAAINWQEGQNPNTVNDSARAMMAAVAAFKKQQDGTITSGGTANAQTFTSPSGFAFTAYAAGMVLTFTAGLANTGSATLNVDGLGAKTLKKFGSVNLEAGDIDAGAIVTVIYDGTNFQVVSGLSSANTVALEGLSGSANTAPYFTGAGALALATLSAFGRTLIDDADAAGGRSTLGLGTAATVNTGTGAGDVPTITQADGRYAIRSNNLSDLSSAATARTNLGLGSLATLSSVNNGNWSGTDLALVNGGTGASDAATARTNLGLGTVATQNANNLSVNITSGSVAGITDLAVADGGTGASDAATARSNLGITGITSASLASTGYVVFENGFKVMWGSSFVNANGTTVISYPTAFSSFAVPVISAAWANVNASDNVPGVTSTTTTNFSVWSALDVGATGFWIAVGV